MVQRVGEDRLEKAAETAGCRGRKAGSRAAVVGFSNARTLCNSLLCDGKSTQTAAHPNQPTPLPRVDNAVDAVGIGISRVGGLLRGRLVGVVRAVAAVRAIGVSAVEVAGTRHHDGH
jgi:hypothetical protein